ncbi:MAG: hypothetical protein HKN33_10665 [Pyrinomonadaceae bacterium]|nr:hypothetical protein [Pyrinomonadaceae bacterium]
MRKKFSFRTAHTESVNSTIVNFDAGVVISFDDTSIRIWNPVSGTEVYQSEIQNEDSVIPGLGSTYNLESVMQLDS